MWDSLSAMLPYAVGLLVSPLPVAAVIMLLVSDGGSRKATVFELTWLVVSFAIVIGVAAIVGQAPPRDRGTMPAWEAWVLSLLGAALLGLAFLVFLAWRRQRRMTGDLPVPRWMRALDGLSPAKTAGLAAILIVANPVNVSMLLAAGIELGHLQSRFSAEVLPAALFVTAGSLTMLAPWLVTVISGRGTGFLPRARGWLLVHNNALTFWMTLAFGLVFLSKGLRAFT